MGKAETKCPNCGLAYQDFRRIGRLGCSECYETFKDSLRVLLKRIHGSTQHLGRTPAKKVVPVQKRSEIDTWRGKLQRAIEMEEFEQAARLRDKIRALEAKKKKEQRRSK